MNRSKSPLTRNLVGVVGTLALALVFYGTPADAASAPRMVKDINPGFADSNPTFLTAMNGTLYFGAKGSTKGRELWRSDGTSAGTKLVKDIRPGKQGSDPGDLAAVGGLLYFSATDGVSGRELWVSDGSAAGTRLVKDINPGSADSNPRGFTKLNGAVYFFTDGSAGRELWRTDGTASGTIFVKGVNAGYQSSNPEALIPFAGKLFFLGECAPSCTYAGVETLYRTDGTPAGTRPFTNSDGDIVTGWIHGLSAIGGRLYYELVPDGGDTGGLWRSNGKAATTRQISDLGMYAIADVDGTAFIEGDGQIWTSNGTAATTVPVKAIEYNGGFLWAVAGDRLFFDAIYGDWWHTIWVSDGTADGTQPLKSVYTLTDESASIGSVLYFAGTTDNDYTLWRSDGTADGTYSVGGTEANMWDMTAAGKSVYWVSDADNHGNELWRYTP